MAKKAAKTTKGKRGALGSHGLDPLAAGGFGGDRPAGAASGPRNRAGAPVTPTAFRLSEEIMAQLRGAAFALGRTAASIVEDALREHLAKLEKADGPFPRPMK